MIKLVKNKFKFIKNLFQFLFLLLLLLFLMVFIRNNKINNSIYFSIFKEKKTKNLINEMNS
jgi:hypothetical protein